MTAREWCRRTGRRLGSCLLAGKASFLAQQGRPSAANPLAALIFIHIGPPMGSEVSWGLPGLAGVCTLSLPVPAYAALGW